MKSFETATTISAAPEAIWALLTDAPGMREAYHGLLAPLVSRSVPDLQPAFDEFAAALKQRAESDR